MSLNPLTPRGALTLLYWIYFKPSALRQHIHSLAPELADQKGKEARQQALRHPKLSPFIYQTIIFIFLASILLTMIFGLSVVFAGEEFNWLGGLIGVMFNTMFAIMIADAFEFFGVASAVEFGIMFANGNCLIASVVCSYILQGGVFLYEISGFMRSMSASVAIGIGLGMTRWSVPFMLFIGISGGITFGVMWGMALTLFWLIVTFRVPFYIMQCPWFIWLERCKDPLKALAHSPALWDDFLILPHPNLGNLLARAIQQDREVGLSAMAQIAYNPFQRWAIGQALYQVWGQEPNAIFPLLNHLLRYPSPATPYLSSVRFKLKQDAFLATKLIIGEVCEKSPLDTSTRITESGFGIAPLLTFPWRRYRRDPNLKRLAEVYLALLDFASTGEEYFDLVTEGRIMRRQGVLLATFEPFKEVQHGLETYQTFATLDEFLKYRKLRDLPDALKATNWIGEIANPLRPDVLALFKEFAQVGSEIATYQQTSGNVAKRDALTRAGLLARTIEERSLALPPPESSIVKKVAEQWAELIAGEQEEVAQPQPILRINSRYIVGRSLRPEHGRLFAGREDIFQRIRDLWEGNPEKKSLILHGERRMGKTSILLHLQERLSAEYVPIFLNLQTEASVQDFGEFLYNVAHTVHGDLSKALNLPPTWLAPPTVEQYKAHTLVPFKEFFERVNEVIVAQEKTLVLLFDEFEMLEDKINAGVFPKDLLLHFRHLMYNARNTALILAGCHTLESMTHEYWNPFFGITTNLRISYLSREAAEEIITNPWDGFELQYTREAVEAIRKATGGQGMLLQDTCQTIIQLVNQRLRATGAQILPTVTLPEAHQAFEQVLKESNYFKAFWSDPTLLKPHERLTLAALAAKQERFEGGTSRAEVDRCLKVYLDHNRIEEAWNLIKQREMVEQDGEIYRFRVDLVWQWVRKYQPLGEVAQREGKS